MAIGDAVQVGIAARLKNWRGENDYDVNGVPDDWTTNESAVVQTLVGEGVAGLFGIAMQLPPTANSTVSLFTKENAVPVPHSGDIAFPVNFGAYFKKHPTQSYTAPSIKIRLLDSDLGEEDARTTTPTPILFYNNFWVFAPQNSIYSDNMTSDTAYVEVQFKRNSGGTWEMIDSPFLCWRADGASGGLYSFASTPTHVRCDPINSRGAVRDSNQTAYRYGSDGGRQLWQLELTFDYLDPADYAYLKECYAVNTGKSGYRNAAGNRLDSQPIVVMPHIYDPPTSGTAGKSEQARPPVIIGDMSDPQMTFREYIGFGYSGTLTITEVPGD